MKDIEIITFEKLSKKSYQATGRVGNKSFEAKTIVHNGNPIFKIYEEGKIKKLTDVSSKFSLGERQSIAAFLKKYAKGKIDKEGRPVDNQRSPGVGITIQLQNKIDDLLLENKKLRQLLEGHGIQHHIEHEEDEE